MDVDNRHPSSTAATQKQRKTSSQIIKIFRLTLKVFVAIKSKVVGPYRIFSRYQMHFVSADARRALRSIRRQGTGKPYNAADAGHVDFPKIGEGSEGVPPWW